MSSEIKGDEPSQAQEHEAQSLLADAARWRALMRCGKIKMQGSSGVDPKTGERNGNSVHFGAEFWPEPSSFPDLAAKEAFSTQWGVACLTALADAILEREAAALASDARGLVRDGSSQQNSGRPTHD